MDDLVKFVALSPTPYIQHIELDGRQIYFVHALGLGRSIIYYVELDKRVEKKYVVYNRFRDEIGFSDTFSADGQTIYIPILELERTNLFTQAP